MENVKVISGGQTGADRGGLDAARQLGMETGGWCPKGRKAEDGFIPEEYNLIEMDTDDYKARTRKNVDEADYTIIFYEKSLTGGSLMTRNYARAVSKPYVTINLLRHEYTQEIGNKIHASLPPGVRIINVAGSRESKCPGIHEQVKRAMLNALPDIKFSWQFNERKS